MNKHLLTAIILAAAMPAVAQAQDVNTPEPGTTQPSVFDGDYITLGGAALYTPSYEGSDDQVFSGAPLAQGRVAGIGINPRAGGIGLDFINDPKDAKIGFSLGPVATYSRNRHSNIHDDVVEAAGKLKSAIDVGVGAGISARHVLDPYDTLSLNVDVKWNVNSASKGMVVTPSVSYLTPLSKAMLVTLNVYAKHVDSDYADYYYDVNPVQSAASGLPQYNARKSWAAVGGGILAAYDLSGNLLDGGLALIAGVNYSKLLTYAKHTPYTSIRGDDDQWTFGAGLAYTF